VHGQRDAILKDRVGLVAHNPQIDPMNAAATLGGPPFPRGSFKEQIEW
jgi:hypothetical protein